MKTLLLTIDLEEFDLPEDFDSAISKKEKYLVPREGLRSLIKLLNKTKTKATFFTTITFAKKYPSVIKSLAKDHEIALHALDHKDNYQAMEPKEVKSKLKLAIKELEKLSGQKIVSFRAPRFMHPPYEVLHKVGIKYDSSLHPTWVPGRYFNMFKPRKTFTKNKVKIFPVSVTPIIRAPISFVWFRNFGLRYTKVCSLLLRTVNMYFHPWEFTDITKFEIPNYIKKNTGTKLESSLKSYLLWLKKRGFESRTIKEFANLSK